MANCCAAGSPGGKLGAQKHRRREIAIVVIGIGQRDVIQEGRQRRDPAHLPLLIDRRIHQRHEHIRDRRFRADRKVGAVQIQVLGKGGDIDLDPGQRLEFGQMLAHAGCPGVFAARSVISAPSACRQSKAATESARASDDVAMAAAKISDFMVFSSRDAVSSASYRHSVDMLS